MKHTPGPWVIQRNQRGYPYGLHAPNGSHVKDVTRWAAFSVPSLPEGEANARLIAAAPDLLSACEFALTEALAYCEEGDDSPNGEIIIRLRAAIANAVGQEVPA